MLRSFTFILISCRLFENDWRIALFEPLRTRGFDYYHLRLGKRCILTNPRTRTNRTFHLIEFRQLLREIHRCITSRSIPVYFVSTATAAPSLVLALKVLLRRGLWLFDVYDDYSLYWGPPLQRAKGRLINWLFYRLMTATIIAPSNLRAKFPEAFDLPIASSISRTERDCLDLNKIIITSNFDPRLDYDFIRDVAEKRPDHEIHLYGRIQNYTRDWPALQRLLNVASNVKYHGEFPEETFGDMLSQYGVALAPFKAHAPFTHSTDPARFYDYLNAGLEIISTDIPRARDRSAFVHIAKSADDAVDIWKALENKSGLRKSRHWDFAEHSWQRRSEQLLKILDHLCEQHGAVFEPASFYRGQ